MLWITRGKILCDECQYHCLLSSGTLKEHLSLQSKTFCQSDYSLSSQDAPIFFMWQAQPTSEQDFRGWISNVISPSDSPVRKVFVYVNFPAEQAARADLPSPEMKRLKIDPASPITLNSSHCDFTKASIIDGFPNEFKQRGFKAGFFLPSEKWNELWKQNTPFPFELWKGNLLPLHIPEYTACFLSLPLPFPPSFRLAYLPLSLPFFLFFLINWLRFSCPNLGKVYYRTVQ